MKLLLENMGIKKLDQISVSLLRGLLTTASILGGLVIVLFILSLLNSSLARGVYQWLVIGT